MTDEEKKTRRMLIGLLAWSELALVDQKAFLIYLATKMLTGRPENPLSYYVQEHLSDWEREREKKGAAA
jgi:hypothetical protein